MSRERFPALSAGRCHELEKIRLAIEIQTGLRARCINIDFHTGKALYYVNATSHTEGKYLTKSPAVDVTFRRAEPIYFYFTMYGEEYSIRHYDSQVGYVEVVAMSYEATPGFWVGTSFADRRQKVLKLVGSVLQL